MFITLQNFNKFSSLKATKNGKLEKMQLNLHIC